MKYFPLVWAGLWRKPVRTIFTLLSVVVAFVLFGVLQAVDAGFAQVQAASRLDRLLVDSKFGAPMPVAYGAQIGAVPGVTAVAHNSGMGGYWQDPKNGYGVNMVDDQFFVARPEIEITKDQLRTWRQTRTALVVSPDVAARYGWKVGDKIPLTTRVMKKDGTFVWTFDLVAIVDDGDFPIGGIGHYDYVDQTRAKDTGTVGRFIVRIRDPGRAAQVSKQIDLLFANASVETRTQPEKLMNKSGMNSSFNIGAFTKSVVGAVFFSLLFVTANTIMQSVRERTSEFAVLKTIGYSNTTVLGLVLGESGLICLIGAGFGLAISIELLGLIRKTLGPFHMSWTVAVWALAAAIAVAVVSGLPPAWRASRIVIVDALAGR